MNTKNNGILKKMIESKMIMKKTKKFKISIIFLFIIGILLILLYGPYSGFRNFLITSSMTTKNHQHIAKFFYSERVINEVMSNHFVEERQEISDPALITIGKRDKEARNRYEEKILNYDPDALYQIIEVRGLGFRGHLIAIYDPSKVHLVYSKYLGEEGQTAKEVALKTNSSVVMNASGFFDPYWRSNGSTPHGTVISRGEVIVENEPAGVGGGFIGFNNDDKLILGNMSLDEALEVGYRDAIEFGPFLIINGQSSTVHGNGGWGIASRAAIGQRKDGIVLFLVIDGRLTTSLGADMNDLINIFEKFGAVNAANLDGGSSTSLIADNQIINTPTGGGSNGLRKIPTFWTVN